jgi:hypothetical protein
MLMTNLDNLTRDTGRAVRARQLLEDEMLVDGFKVLEDAYTLGWRSSKPSDTAGREKLFLAINIIGIVREHLQLAVTNGKIAEVELKEIAQAAERKKRFGVF